MLSDKSLIYDFLVLQAKVEWPADMPDDMLEDAIAISKKTLDEHDFETDGVEVRKAASIRV
jgi:hypothetical protein